MIAEPVTESTSIVMRRPVRRNWRPLAATACVFIVALALRLWGINYGLPFLYHTDEPFLVNVAWRMYQTGDLNPHFWDYPSLQIYSLTVLISLREALSPFLPMLAIPRGEYLLGRLLNVAYSVGTVYLVYRSGRRLFGTWPGIAGAAVLALAEQHNVMTHFLKVDIPTTFYVSATIALGVAISENPTRRNYAIAGVMVGLATAAKYPTATVGIVLIVAHLVTWRRDSWRRIDRILLTAPFAFFAFLATCPYTVLDLAGFWRDFDGSIVSWAATGHDGWDRDVILTYLQWMFLGRDAPMHWLALVGLAIGGFRRDARIALVAAFPILFFVEITALWTVRFPWYVLPMYPAMAIIAAYGTIEAGHWIAQRKPKFVRAWIAVVAIGLTAQLIGSGDRSMSFASEEVRTTALNWINENVPEQSRVVREGYTPEIPQDRFRVSDIWRAIDKDPKWYEDEGVEYLVLGSYLSGRYLHFPDRYPTQVEQYRALTDRGLLIKRFRGPMLGNWDGEIDVFQLRPIAVR